MGFVVYVIQNTQGLLYKGVTNNLEQRLKYHNNGLSRWTRGKGLWRLLHKEEYTTKKEALQREKFLKSGKGRDFLMKRVGKAVKDKYQR